MEGNVQNRSVRVRAEARPYNGSPADETRGRLEMRDSPRGFDLISSLASPLIWAPTVLLCGIFLCLYSLGPDPELIPLRNTQRAGAPRSAQQIPHYKNRKHNSAAPSSLGAMGQLRELQTSVVKPGSGPAVAKGQRVTVHATGSVLNPDGTTKKFWSTKDAGQQPFTWQAGLGQVIAGWDQGVLGMNLGETRIIHIPAKMGYGASGFPAWGIPPNADLQFEIECLQIL